MPLIYFGVYMSVKKQINKCENCGSGILFDVDSQSLKCSHCGSLFPIPAPRKENAKYKYTNESVPLSAKEDFSQFKCNNCNSLCVSGFMDESQLRCPSCGSSNLSKTVSVNYEPDGIFPFKVKKETALQNFKGWLKKRKMAPFNLRKIATLDKIVGTYCPCWNLDFKDTFSYSCTGVKETKHKNGQTTTSKTRLSDTITRSHYDYLQSANSTISAYDIRNTGSVNFEELKAYSPSYMYGFTGLISDQTIHRAINITKDEISSQNEKEIKNQLNLKYDRLENFRSSTSLFDTYYNNIYLPIWLINYKYKKKFYRCYINGVNGQASGNAPVSGFKIFLIILLVLGFIGLIIWLSKFN